MVAIMNPSIMILLTITSSVSRGRVDSKVDISVVFSSSSYCCIIIALSARVVRGERWPVERSTDITITEWDPPRYLHTRYLHTTNKISVTRRGAPYQVKYFKCILSGSLKFLSQFIVGNDVYTLSMGP